MSEADTRRAAEIYRQEHETWNVERLMGIFADDAQWTPAGRKTLVGRDAVRTNIERMAAAPGRRRMIHLLEIIEGENAAVEWEVHHLGDDGNWHPYRYGVNLYHVVDGKIKSLRGYGFNVQPAH